MEQRILIECSCGSHILKIEKWEDDYLFLYYDTCKDSLWTRLTQAWSLLIYGDHTSADMVIEGKNFDKLIKFLEEAREGRVLES